MKLYLTRIINLYRGVVYVFFSLFLVLSCFYSVSDNNSEISRPSGGFIIDHTCTDISLIPAEAVMSAKNTLHIGYGHTSHGSQITDGMADLDAFMGGTGLYTWSQSGAGDTLHLYEGDGYGTGDLDHDCGYYPAWVNETRAFLGGPNPVTGRGTLHSEFNVIMWSWCGQVSSLSEAYMISNYLAPMNQLENEYPGILFIYMTGHLDGSGTAGNLHQRNEQIRSYCLANNKTLYDFADIESYDPEGNYYLDQYATDACNYDYNESGATEQSGDPALPLNGDRNWAIVWQESHAEGVAWYSCGAAHSQPLNANRKAYAAWWLWARLAGWDGD